MASYFPVEHDWQLRYERAKDVADSLGRPLIYMTKDKRYFDERGNEVILFDEHGEPTEIGTKAVVIPVKPETITDG